MTVDTEPQQLRIAAEQPAAHAETPAPALRIVHRGGEERLPMVVVVESADGAWTPGPYCGVECGNEIEFTVDELAWLIEDAGPAALEALRALAAETPA